jgi:hypothetical protein
MKKLLLFIMFLSILSCSVTSKKESKPLETGFIDDDTYTVIVTDKNEENAIARARHQILKDIVDVRMRINSSYTDIVKIRDEFEAPLSNGVIIRRIHAPEALTIYYQIRDKGLRAKFQRR